MILFVSYAVGISGIIWYTLVYLPFQEFTQHVSFALNIAQLGLLSLLSFLVYRQETVFRSIFFHFWFFFACMAMMGPVFFHCLHWYGEPGGFWAAVEILIIGHGLFLWIAAQVLLTYVFHEERRWILNLVATLVVVPLCAWLFWPFWWSPHVLLTLPTAEDVALQYAPVERKLLVTNAVSLAMLLAFFVQKLRTDRPLGVYADTLLFFFGIYVLLDTLEYLVKGTSVELQSMTQWAAALVTAGMIVTLLLRLKFKSQTIARYYESQCLSGDPRIDRRIGWFDRFIVRSFFDPEKVSQRVFFGAGNEKMKVKRSSVRAIRSTERD